MISLFARWPIFHRLKQNSFAATGAVVLIVLYFLAGFAGFFSPYSPIEDEFRDFFFHPPTPIHFRDEHGEFHMRPFVYSTQIADRGRMIYTRVTQVKLPVRFFISGREYVLFGFYRSRMHIFGVDSPGHIFLFGTDQLGRDTFSRVLHGAQISLSIGLVGVLLTTILGMLFGGIAGFYGGKTDALIMRFAEILMSIPALYLILTLRSILPDQLDSRWTYLILVAVLSLAGWAGMSRVIRGMVLAIREEEFVVAARALGGSDARILLHHILPNTLGYAVVRATLLVPAYILAEVALSFLGAGVREPVPSWGNMLAAAQNLRVLEQFTWTLSPGVFLFLTVLAFNFIGDGLRDALDPKLR